MTGILAAASGGAGFYAFTHLTSRSVDITEVGSPYDSEVTFLLYSTGQAATITKENGITGPVNTISGQWLVSGDAADWECRATLNSGTLSTGTTGSWLALTSTRSWSVARSTLGISSAEITLEIRHAASGVVTESATISFSVTCEP